MDPAKDCRDIRKMNSSAVSGSYRIYPSSQTSFPVYCDFDTDGGDWSVSLVVIVVIVVVVRCSHEVI